MASAAEEEISDPAGTLARFAKVDEWVRAILAPGTPLRCARSPTRPNLRPVCVPDEQDGAGAGKGEAANQAGVLLALAAEIAKGCASQLDRARACYTWVAYHITPPPNGRAGVGSVEAPLLAHAPAEAALVGDVGGTWSERAATLFSRLARACELEAVTVPGFWKGTGTITPGTSISAHNHCWSSVKVGVSKRACLVVMLVQRAHPLPLLHGIRPCGRPLPASLGLPM